MSDKVKKKNRRKWKNYKMIIATEKWQEKLSKIRKK